MSDITGKVATVTGAGSGIGRAVARLFAHHGAAVAINFFGHGEGSRKLAQQIEASGGAAFARDGDVSDATAVSSLVEATVETFGRLDVLVNNAGIDEPHMLLEIDEATWERALAVDLKGPFLCLQASALKMKDTGGGSIVNISAIHEDLPFPSYRAYVAAKGRAANAHAKCGARTGAPWHMSRQHRAGRHRHADERGYPGGPREGEAASRAHSATSRWNA